jgi:hypothetical protein
LQKEQNDVSAKSTDTLLDIGLTLIGAFFGKKTLSASTIKKGASALNKGRAVLKEKGDVENVQTLIENTNNELQELQNDLQEELEKISQEFRIENFKIDTISIKPRRADIIIKELALLWRR